MAVQSLVARAKTKFGLKTDKQLAVKLGITVQSVQNWKWRDSPTARQIVELLHHAMQASQTNVKQTAIRPIVEFCRIERCGSKHGKSYEIFSANGKKGTEHPYRSGLRAELRAHKGVYIFFDSRGQAIYAGKAQKQTLWKEINLAFNRNRGDVQSIMRVKHPANKVAYTIDSEKNRQIRPAVVPLHDMAHYVSAYEVLPGMVGVVEAMLVRSFANDLLNVRMERFDNGAKKAKSRKRAKR